MKDFYTTKLTVEIEISTQMGPDAAFNIVHDLARIPAITGLNVAKAESNFNIDEVRAGSRVPSKEFVSVPIPAWVKS